jgi:hypothetical protein
VTNLGTTVNEPRAKLAGHTPGTRRRYAAPCFALVFALGCAGRVSGDEMELVELPPPPPPHWSFAPMAQPDPPDMANAEWVRNEIDQFVLSGLQNAGREPAPLATPETLLRRVTLDLTGLPPTVEELDAFIADPSEEAYGAVVDRLLASSRYAEHMASEWLDMARYSDTDGFQYDISRPAWPWRDWVIWAFDTNLPFDQFTIDQIAGDLVPNRTNESTLATAFNRNHAIQGENGLLKNEFRDRYVSDRVDTMGKAWLGLTLGCSKCHDHKFDPIKAKDYFRLYDCFNQLDEGDNGPTSEFYPTVKIGSPFGTQLTETIDARIAALTEASAPAGQVASLEVEKVEIEKLAPVRIMWDSETKYMTQQLALGRYDSPVGDAMVCAAPESLPPFPEGAPPTRLGLAQWLVMPENPLVPRVTVNRIWAHHFGRGLTKSIDDFGTRTESPVHRDLLDWLGRHFVDSGWDLKALHRFIVMSNTYRQSSATVGGEIEADLENELLGRGPRYRLSAEVIRDLPLFASGLLVERMGGPPTFPYQPAGLWEELAWEGLKLSYPVRSGDTLYRRSVYSFWKKTLPPPFMSLFDAPDRELASAQRDTAVSPQQSLALLNGVQFVEAARRLAEQEMVAARGDAETAIRRAFRRVTSRFPNERELGILLELFLSQDDAFDADPDSAMRLQAVGDSAPSERTLVAMTQVVRVMFNLHETITLE